MGRESQRQSRFLRDHRPVGLLAVLFPVLACAVIALIVLLYSPGGGQKAAAAFPSGLDSISVQLSFDPQPALVTAEQKLTIENRTETAQSHAVLRSYTGAFLLEETTPATAHEYADGFEPGGTMIDSVRLGDEEAVYRWLDEASTVLAIEVPGGWQAGQTVTVTLRWHAAIPRCTARFGEGNGVWALGNMIPVPALWQDGEWHTEPFGSVGDPFVTGCADWDVTLQVPAGYAAAASCYADPKEQQGLRTYHWQGQAMRDFAIAISRDWKAHSAVQNGVRITVYARSGKIAKQLLQVAGRAVRCFSEAWGTAPYPSLTICETDLPDSGMTYPGMVMLPSLLMTGDTDALAWSAAQEIAHQWWGMAVGTDGAAQPWIDESLAVYGMLRYIGDTQGSQSMNSAMNSLIEAAQDAPLPEGITPASPATAFSSRQTYSYAVCYRPLAFWRALGPGQEGLDTALGTVYSRYRYGMLSAKELVTVLSECTGKELSDLAESILN